MAVILHITLPIPSVQGQNGRSHWRTRAASSRQDRFLAGVEGRVVLGGKPPLATPRLVIDWYCPTKRKVDFDNAMGMCKAYIDGLTDAGWWKDDKDIVSGMSEVHLPDKARGLVGVVVITAFPSLESFMTGI